MKRLKTRIEVVRGAQDGREPAKCSGINEKRPPEPAVFRSFER
jgi:hypothetical protein